MQGTIFSNASDFSFPSLFNFANKLRHTIGRYFIGLCWVLIVTASPAALCQTFPVTADDQMGIQPYQSYHGGEIDHIGLTSGTLALDYPFLSYTQRGQLGLSFHLFYNNQPQHTAEQCVGDPPHKTCTWLWNWTPAPRPLPLEKGDVFVGWEQQL